MTEFTNILLDIKGSVATVILNRPQRLNVLNQETLLELDNAFQIIAKNENVSVVVWRSNSMKMFTAGADIREMREKTVLEAIEFARLGHKIGHTIERDLPPVIAVLNGFVFGGGVELSCACDLRIATPDAIFAQPEIDIGIIPGWGGTQRLCRIVGLGKAKEMIYTGKHITAEEALSIGLVNMIVPHEQLELAILHLTGILSAKSRPALISAKRAIAMALEAPLNAGLAYEIQAWGALFDTYDVKEAMNAFLEKREPKYKNK